MADLVFRSTTRGGRDFFEVTDDGMAYGGKDRYNIKTDESMNYADTVDEVLAELVFDGAWRINYDKIEVDELGIGKEFLEITKLIRKKYNWLYNLPKGSKGRQFYFDIGRYFRQELKKGTDYGKIFDKIDDVIEKNNNFEESKKSNKKSLKENLSRYDMIGEGFFVLISNESFGLCEQLGNKTQDTNWIRSFDTEKQAINFANKKGYPIIYEKLNESKKIKESYEYEDIRNEKPIIDVWGNSEGTHVYQVYKIKSDYIYYEYDYRRHEDTLIEFDDEIRVITHLMYYLPTKYYIREEDNIGMLNSAIINIKEIKKHYGALKKYDNNYYSQVFRFITNSMIEDDEPQASKFFKEADEVLNNAFEKNDDDFRI